MAKRNPRTPEERAEIVEKANQKARKSYRHNTKRKKSASPEEMELITDCIVPLRAVGYSNLQIAMIVGLSKGQVSEISRDPKTQKRISELKTKLPQAAVGLMQAYLIEAVVSVVHVMRTTDDEAMILRAADWLADRGGAPKMTKAENKVDTEVTHSPESDSIFDRLRQSDPEIQEKASQLRDAFEEGLTRLLGGDSGNP